MQNLSMFRETPDPIFPRPIFSEVRERPGFVLCDLKWGSEDGCSRVEFYDVSVELTGSTCQKEGCGGHVIEGTIPGHRAFLVCCRCQDRNPLWLPALPGLETYSSIAERLLRQAGTPSLPADLPRPGDSNIAERYQGGEPVRAIARALDVPPQRVRRRLRALKRRTPGLLRLNPNSKESI